MSGEPSGRTGKPEQGLDRGAQVAQGALLQSKDGLMMSLSFQSSFLLSFFYIHTYITTLLLFCVVTMRAFRSSWHLTVIYPHPNIFFSVTFACQPTQKKQQQTKKNRNNQIVGRLIIFVPK